MHPHRGISRSNSRALRQIVQTPLIQIDGPQSLTVFGLERLEQTLTHWQISSFSSASGVSMRTKFPAPAFLRPLRRCAVAIVIDHGVAEHPVKPRHGAFFVPHFGATLEALHERRLQNIFRGGSGFDPGLEECQELPVMIHQALYRLWGERSG